MDCKYDINKDVTLLLKRAGLNIQKLKGKRIFLTGATGFFGVWMLTTLVHVKNALGSDLKLVVLSRNPASFLKLHPEFEDHVEFICGDLCHFQYGRRDITHLIHMATTNAAETFAGQDQLSKLELLYGGTQNLLAQCEGRLESVLMTSSGVAYGTGQVEKVAETTPGLLDTTDERSALALGKMVAEFLVSTAAAKLHYKFAIARCFSFAGPYLPLDLHYAFGNFIRNAQLNEPIVIKGDGRDRRSYLYIGDAMAWLLNLLLDPHNSIYNVGSENDLTIFELATKITRRTGNALPIKVLSESKQNDNFHRAGYTPSTGKIRTDYPILDEWTPVDEIIEKMLPAKLISSSARFHADH